LQGQLPRVLTACLALGLAAGCTINPVTGERQLAIVSAADEVAIGSAQYLPSQLMQGGEYLRDPALTTYVQTVGTRLADVSDRDLPYEFVILNSSVPNAWALPGGKIAINRGLLLELESEAELAAVLGHEIVHAAARHGAQAMQRGILISGAVAITGAVAGDSDYSNLVVGAASLGAQLVNMRHGRGAELESDAYGMQYMSRAGYDPSAAINLQQTFVRLSGGGGGGGRLATLFASHPPSTERVEQNRLTAASLPAGGTIGREAYMNATARLRREAPGFAAIDAAREALADDDTATARREADRAAETLADSADLAALRGDIEMAAGRPEQAAAFYDEAIARNDRFFRYELGLGSARLARNQLEAAAAAFQASNALLPTADAYLGLGRVAEARGNIPTALEHYAQAAESSGQAGAAARAAILRLDLPTNPGNYLNVATALDSNGRLVIEISNPTSVPVSGITLAVSYLDAGQVQQTRRSLSDTIAPGTIRRYTTGLGPFTASNQYNVSIETAAIAESQ
jgi:predicted Zn-dependent protease